MSAAGNLPTTRARSSSMDMADQPIGVKNLIFDNTRAYQQRHPDINEEKHWFRRTNVPQLDPCPDLIYLVIRVRSIKQRQQPHIHVFYSFYLFYFY